MGSRGMALLVAAAVAMPVLISMELAQQAPANAGDWPHYNRDERSSRYSPLNQITAANVAQLQPAWSFTPRRDNIPPPPAGGRGQRGGAGVGNEVVPIVINGVMYVPAGNLVLAIDAGTGQEIWRYQLTQGNASSRGVNYWPGDGSHAPRILFTAGRNLIALHAATV